MAPKSFSLTAIFCALVVLIAGGCEPEDEYQSAMSPDTGPSVAEIALTPVVVPVLLMGHADPQDLWIDPVFNP